MRRRPTALFSQFRGVPRQAVLCGACALASALIGAARTAAAEPFRAREDACASGGTAQGSAATEGAEAAAATPVSAAVDGEVVVTAPRLALLGTATTASEGVVTNEELQLTPAYRPGQLLETVPGLIVTLHSGEGKANQYLMRGYNLDHGTDLATFVDGMPINQPTHAHGQGYTDLNFLIPELADKVTYTKGPYYADVGDFGGVGAVQISLRDAIPDTVEAGVGSYGFERVFGATSQVDGAGRLVEAIEAQHYDGPFTNPDDARKVNAVVRYSGEAADGGYSVTASAYHQIWTNTTDVPLRAVNAGVIGFFGTLDPTDGGDATRVSVSAQAHADLGGGQFSGSTFYIFNKLNIFNDFTHFLVDPAHGDQEDQFESRNAVGGSARYAVAEPLGPIRNDVVVGGLVRYDLLQVGRLPSQDEQPLPSRATLNDPASFSDDDHVQLLATAAYVQATTYWTPRLRTVLGLRGDFQYGVDHDLLAALHETAGYSNGGVRSQFLPQPKASVIYAARRDLELYASAGEGFHSADLRGVNQDKSVDLGLPGTPLLAKQYGEEVGVRATPSRAFTATLAAYTLWQQSETIIDPDVGQDAAGPASERYGFEINVTYQIRRWLEFYGSFSGNHARFTTPFADGTGHLGTFITDAPAATGLFSLYLNHFGPWSGGLDYRYLSAYPLSSGPCVDKAAEAVFHEPCGAAPTAVGQVNGKGFGQLNLDVNYAFRSGFTATFGVYNLLNVKAAAAEFWYVDRLQSEITAYPEGRADIHEHPLEPLMFRVSLRKAFE